MDNSKTRDGFSLEALHAGDRAEFARVVDTYYEMVYRLAIRMLSNPQDAEDILQETFIKAYRKFHNFDGRSSVSTWLYRIATNEALMFLRRQHPELTAIDDTYENGEGLEKPAHIVDWCCLPEEELMSAEAQAYLDEAVESLPPNLRVVFILRDIQGLSTRETAEVLNLTEMAVKTRLSRARFKLRELLSKYYGEKVAEESEL
ncbi:MAG: sigma-70 family RNA polymerase sigma factor [Anaerolineales bacterium]|nr:sigma-70 family RNA polymerase sigma factor [Anaerolineales bacterium]